MEQGYSSNEGTSHLGPARTYTEDYQSTSTDVKQQVHPNVHANNFQTSSHVMPNGMVPVSNNMPFIPMGTQYKNYPQGTQGEWRSQNNRNG
jgi:hypothetical protein